MKTKRTNAINHLLVVLTTTALLSGSACVMATPIGLYAFEGNANDVSGNANNGVVTGALSFDTGTEGMGLDNDPTITNFVNLPLNIRPGVAPRMTIGVFVDADAIDNRDTILSADNGGFDRTLTIDDRSGATRYSAFTGSGGVLGGDAANVADGFVFVAAVYDQVNQTVRLHTNGNNFTANNVTQGDSHAVTRVGSNISFAESIDGSLDNVFVFNHALSVSEVEAIRTGGVAAALSSGVGPGEMIQVDFQADGVNGLFNPAAPITNPGIGAGDVWNSAIVPSFTGVNPIPNPAVNPTFNNLLDSTGAATGISLSINGSVSGFNNGNAANPINTDYIFWGVDGTSQQGLGWAIDGLMPGAEYEFTAFGGAVTSARGFNMLVDTDGDGSLADEISQLVVNTGGGGPFGAGVVFTSVTADENGMILGLNSNGVGTAEANWGGFQLRKISTSAIPEPFTAMLIPLALTPLLIRRRRTA